MKKFILLLVMLPILSFAQTKNIVPRADGEGSIGTFAKAWLSIHTDSIYILGGSIQDLISDSVSNAIVSMDRIQEVVDYEPVMQDSSILLYSGGVWSIFDLGATLAGIVAGTPTLPDSIIYTSELTSGLATKQNVMGSDDNYVTDAQLVIIGNTSGTNTGDNATNTQYSGLATSKQNTLVSGTNIRTVNGNTLLGSGNIAITAGTDSGTVIDLALAEIQTWADSASYESAYDGNAIDSLLALAGTSLQTVTFPDANTIEFKTGVAIQLDPVTLEINGSDQLTVIGGTGFDSTYAYQRIVALENNVSALQDTITSFRNILNSILTALDTCGCGAVIVDNTPTNPPTSLVAHGGEYETQMRVTWTDPVASDLDSIRIYRNSSNDSTSAVWIASIDEAVQTYTNTGLTANTTYWYWAKALDDSSNLSYFSVSDSGKTLASAVADTGFFKFDAEDGLAHLVIDGSMTPYVTDTSGFSYAGSKSYKLRGNSGAVNVFPLAQLPAGSINQDSVWVTYRVYIPAGSTTNETNSTYEYLTLLFNGIDGIGDAGDFGISTDESDNIAGWVKPFGTEVTTNFSTNAWHKIEIKYKNGTGTAQDSIWVDETLIYGTSSATSTSQVDGLYFGYQSWVLLSGEAIYFDDIIFSDHRLPLD